MANDPTNDDGNVICSNCKKEWVWDWCHDFFHEAKREKHTRPDGSIDVWINWCTCGYPFAIEVLGEHGHTVFKEG